MKLISLNIWGGKAYEPLIKFIKEQSADTDIFCFQEVFSSTAGMEEYDGVRVNISKQLQELLPDFRQFSAPVSSGYSLSGYVDFEITESNASFVKSGVNVAASGGVFIRGAFKKLGKGEGLKDIPANLQYIRFTRGGKNFTIANLHGVSQPGDKLDTPDRLAQSEKILDFLRGESGAKIICGDFNLLPETKSIKLLENAELVNLIIKYGVGLTRSRLSPFYGKPDFQKFADYVFASPDVNVLNFNVLEVEVSDHLPMVLEFS